MVQIKRFIAFVLVAAAITPLVSQPIRQAAPPSRREYLEDLQPRVSGGPSSSSVVTTNSQPKKKESSPKSLPYKKPKARKAPLRKLRERNTLKRKGPSPPPDSVAATDSQPEKTKESSSPSLPPKESKKFKARASLRKYILGKNRSRRDDPEHLAERKLSKNLLHSDSHPPNWPGTPPTLSASAHGSLRKDPKTQASAAPVRRGQLK